MLIYLFIYVYIYKLRLSSTEIDITTSDSYFLEEKIWVSLIKPKIVCVYISVDEYTVGDVSIPIY